MAYWSLGNQIDHEVRITEGLKKLTLKEHRLLSFEEKEKKKI